MSPSALSRLLRPVEPLTPAMSISDVADRLLMPEHRAFLSLPVVDDERRVLGLVSRYTLQDIFMQRFGRDLWGRHPVRDVMNRAPLSVSLGASLEEAAQQVTGRLQYPITEDFALVDKEGRYRGLGTVLDLLKAMEARIAQRNRVLRKALVDLKESQAQLVQSEKMASLGQMVAGVAHELNTPLGYVGNNLALLEELSDPLLRLADAQAALVDCLGDPQCDEARLAQVLQAADAVRREAAVEQLREDLRQLFVDTRYGLGQIGELVSGLKDFARLDRAFSEEVDLNDCVRNAVLIARTAIKDKAEISSQLGELPLIACAPSQINQVLLNLLTNAAQAMERFGRILLKSWADERQVFLSVQDNGKGMPAEVLGRIFDPFFTTKPMGQGTGLGLSISYKIIQQHGGTIRVASEPGRGTRFLISLPREQARELKRSA
ncbi:TPA: CBS domain-containing protein [Pseudomonas aeruginosa]|nr:MULTISPECIES: ATP-binding protein [Pseudomonas]AHA16683.1 ATPase [Pseudomonas aeruginosa PA1]AHA22482.1 Signal transduction histidine kinase [Pseudomonas aeruginosa PA1R]ALE47961.1 ATPase [Pseudomonas aeruginosa]KSE46925.1 ATPase [Pseudomonas aeruginosa]MCO2071138.1 CBS domain-containing protein [Pseudomonas aeruginosa]